MCSVSGDVRLMDRDVRLMDRDSHSKGLEAEAKAALGLERKLRSNSDMVVLGERKGGGKESRAA